MKIVKLRLILIVLCLLTLIHEYLGIGDTENREST